MKLLISLAVPLAVGGLSALLSMSGMQSFSQLSQPPLTPAPILFPIVWTLLYLMMGAASYLVYRAGKMKKSLETQVIQALALYGVQLAVNFFWPLIFFRLGWYLTAFFWLALLWYLVFADITRFFPLSRAAGWLMIPYLLWITFAGYLNLGVYFLN